MLRYLCTTLAATALAGLEMVMPSGGFAATVTTGADLAYVWTGGSAPILSSTTSTSSLLLPNGRVRTYYMGSAGFMYQDTTDGATLASTGSATNITPASGLFISNPDVVRLSNGTYLMVHEISTSNQNTSNRYLYVRTSTDGITWGSATQLPNSTKDTSSSNLIFQSVPSVVQEPNGTVRLYYVADGTSTASMSSTDNGANWTQDSGYIFQGSTSGTSRIQYVDPNVVIAADGTRIMFLSYQLISGLVTTGTQTIVVRAALSADGRTFTLLPVDSLTAAANTTFYYDPNVYADATGAWHMHYGQGSYGSNNIHLYHATLAAAPRTGWWYNTAQGGRGFSIETQGSKLFIGTFAYAANGSAIWYVTSCTLSGSTCSGSMEQYANGQTLTGSYVAPTAVGSVGTMSLTFTSPDQATMSWPGGSQTIVRYPFAGVSSIYPGSGSSPQTGWYYSTSEGGRGWYIEVQNQSTNGTATANSLFLSGYMYNAAGQATWYVSTGTMTTTALYEGALTEYSGGAGLTAATYTGPTTSVSRGTVSISFPTATTATLTLPNGQTISLIRYLF